MNKSFTLGLVLVSSFLLSGCSQQTSNNKSVKSEDKSDTSSFSLRELIAQNIPQKCTYSGTNQEGSFESEIIISGKKFKQTLKAKIEGGSDEVINSISDGDYIYTWGNHSSGGAFATKLKADFVDKVSNKETKSEDTKQDISESQFDLDTNYQGKCVATTVSDTDFQPPKDIKFEDYSQFLDNIKSSMPSISTKDLE
jgi:PBP1b-binding outer membrane lipoprotein LpoB